MLRDELTTLTVASTVADLTVDFSTVELAGEIPAPMVE